MQNIFAEICKVNPETRMVYGYASTEAMDVQGERVSKDALAKALPAYMQFANIREMHQPSAVGVAKEATLDDKGLYLAAKVVDDEAWNKVKEGVYKGFSIGGKTVSKVDETITELRLSEISLVDRPANPEAVIEVWKADGVDANSGAISAIDELAALLDAGKIKPEQLLAFAKGEVNEPAPSEPTPEVPQSDTPPDAPIADPSAPQEPAADTSSEPVAPDECGKADLTKFAGQEIHDSAQALQALAVMFDLLTNESAEAENQPDQVACLQAVITNLKAFIASEITEDNSEAMTDVAMADTTGDIAKAGREISSKNLAKLQDLHDMCKSMGAKCDKGDDVAMADTTADLAKAEVVLSKISELESNLAKMTAQTQVLEAEIKRINALPAPSKAQLRVFNKADDTFDGNAPAPVVVDSVGKVNEAASLIKMIHQTGGVR